MRRTFLHMDDSSVESIAVFSDVAAVVGAGVTWSSVGIECYDVSKYC